MAAAFLTPCGLSQLSGSWVSVSWAQTEAPRTLAEALARAEESNTTILNAKQVLEQRYGAVTEARSLLLPRLDVTANYSVQDQALVPAFGGQTFGSDRNWDSRATVRQRLFSGGKAWASYQREDLLRAAAAAELEQTIEQVLLDVKERYFAVLLARSQVGVRQKAVDLLQEELRNAKARLASGTVSDFIVLRAEVELANAKAPLIRAKNQTRLAAYELERILALQPGEITEPDDSAMLKADPVRMTLEDAQAQARESRPELVKLELQVEAAKRQVSAQQADYLPSLFATGGYAVEKDRFADDSTSSLDGWVAGAEATWNIFESFGTQARVDQARAQVEIARSNLKQAKVDVSVEVQRAFASLEEAQELVRASQKVETQGEESTRLAIRRVEAGTGTQVEVLDAQLALTDARNNSVQALYDYNIAVARFEKAAATRSRQSGPR